MKEYEVRMIDIFNPDKEVEIQIEKEGERNCSIWVNVDGVCRLRIKGVNPKILKVECNGVDLIPSKQAQRKYPMPGGYNRWINKEIKLTKQNE